MTTPTVPPHLLRQFPKMRQERGRRLFDQGAAELLEAEGGDEILGLVRDRHHRRSPLHVAISLEGDDDLVEADCTCLGPSLCEHAFALVLTHPAAEI